MDIMGLVESESLGAGETHSNEKRGAKDWAMQGGGGICVSCTCKLVIPGRRGQGGQQERKVIVGRPAWWDGSGFYLNRGFAWEI